MNAILLATLLLGTSAAVSLNNVTGGFSEYWFGNKCSNTLKQIQKKQHIISQIHKLLNVKTNNDKNVEENEDFLKQQMYVLFEREMNASEAFVFSALNVFSETLKGNLDEVEKLKEHSIHRIHNLQQAIFNEELELKEISQLEDGLYRIEKNKRVHNKTGNAMRLLFNEMLQELELVASDIGLESVSSPNKSRQPLGDIEAVFQVRGEEAGFGEEDRPAEVLIDTENNKYILSKPKDATMSFEDRRLIMDIMVVIITSFVFSHIGTLLSQPPILGYIIAGVVTGPSGLNLVTDIVQIETLGEIGVFFAVLDVGLGFSLAHVKAFWRVIFIAFPSVVFLVSLAFGLFSSVIGMSSLESGIVSFCFALSTSHMTGRISEDHLKMYYTGQDVFLGLALAIMPYIRERNFNSFLLFMSIKSFMLCCFIGLFVFYAKRCVSRADSYLGSVIKIAINSHYPTVIILVLFSVVLLGELCEVSIDLLCFVLGALIYNSGIVSPNQERLVTFKQFFSCLFYVAIGFHLFPSFVYYELSLVIVLTTTVLSIKFCFLFLIFSKLVPNLTGSQKLLSTLAACNVGELSLIVGSRARLYSMLSKEVYLLVISVSTVSLALTPLWNYIISARSIHVQLPP